MNVSPTGRQNESFDQESLDALPPTLFTLRNLKEPLAVPQQAPVTAPGPAVIPNQTAAAIKTAPNPPIASALDTGSEFSRNNDPEPVMVVNSVNDGPAGRGWMEKIGSHAFIMVLLSIVVATAIVTGRKSNSTTHQDAFIASDSVSEMDANDFEITTSLGDADESTASKFVASAALDTPEIETTAVIRTAPTAWDNDDPTINVDSLDAIAASSRVNEQTTHNEQTHVEHSDNHFSAPTSVDLTSDLLARSSSQAASDSNATPTTQRRYTQTPAGINDWSRHLPDPKTVPVRSASNPVTK